MGGWLLALLIGRIEFLQVRADNWDRPPVRRWGRRFRLREHDIDRATAWFDRHGPAAVFFGHLLPVIRTFISLPAGFAAMPAVRFGVYTTAGCIPWTAGLSIVVAVIIHFRCSGGARAAGYTSDEPRARQAR